MSFAVNGRKLSALASVLGTAVSDSDFWPIVVNGITQKISVAALRLKLGQNSKVFNVMDYGAANDNTNAPGTTAAVQAAALDANAYATTAGSAILYFPSGHYAVTDTITINQHHVHVRGAGDGKYGATIHFTPTSAKALFLFKMLDGSSNIVAINQCSIKGFGFVGGGAFQKIGVDIYDGSEFEMLDVVTSGWTTTGTYDENTVSIALRTNGRQHQSVGRVDFYADRPIHIRVLASNIPFSADHFHFFDMLLGPVFRYQEDAILVDPDVVLSNLTMDGYQSWVTGRHGFNWQGTSGTVSQNLTFKNIRREQIGTAPTGTAAPYSYGAVPATSDMWTVLATGAAHNITLENCFADPGAAGRTGHGFKFAADTVTLTDCRYEGNTGGGVNVGLDVSSGVVNYSQINSFFQAGGTVNMGSLREQLSVQTPNYDGMNFYPIAPTCFYTAPGDATNASHRPGMRKNGKYENDVSGTLADATELLIQPQLAQYTMARIKFTFHENARGSVDHAAGTGTFLLKSNNYGAPAAAGTDTSGLVTEATTTRLIPRLAADADVAGKVSIRWFGQGLFKIYNATGVSIKYFYTIEYLF